MEQGGLPEAPVSGSAMGSVARVESYAEKWEASHSEFAARRWPTNPKRWNPAYIRWKFRGPAKGPVEGLLLAVEGDRVLGQLGVIPVEIGVGTKVMTAQWACDLMVDPAERWRGLGSVLLRASMERDTVTLGSDPSPAARVVMAKLGFRDLAGPRVMVLPLRADHVLRKLPRPLRPAVRLASPLVQAGLELRYRRLHSQEEAGQERDWMTLVPEIMGRGGGEQGLGVRHDEAFLSWRCSGFGGEAREAISFGDGAGGFALVTPVSDYFFVDDWHAKGPDQARTVFRAVYRRAISEGMVTLNALAQNEGEERILGEIGFLPTKSRVRIIYYPSDALAGWTRFRYCYYDSDENL